MVQTFPPRTSQEPFAHSIGSRRFVRGSQYLDTAACRYTGKPLGELAVIVPDQIFRHLSVRRCLPELLSYPPIGWRSCHAEVDYPARAKLYDKEDEEGPKEQVVYWQEIACPHLVSMVMQECCPVLAGLALCGLGSAGLSHVLLDCSFAHSDVKFE